jgi:hypothetical protein
LRRLRQVVVVELAVEGEQQRRPDGAKEYSRMPERAAVRWRSRRPDLLVGELRIDRGEDSGVDQQTCVPLLEVIRPQIQPVLVHSVALQVGHARAIGRYLRPTMVGPASAGASNSRSIVSSAAREAPVCGAVAAAQATRAGAR